MNPISKLGIGPLSQEIIEAAFRYSQQNKIPLMLISSLNQIDWDGGYVNNWTTKQYVHYVATMRKQYPKAQIYICRDHCGPGFKNNEMKNVYKTLDADIEAKFDLIHIDFCHLHATFDDVLEESRKAIAYVLDKSPKTLIEIGTDENTGYNLKSVEFIDQSMRYFTNICNPHFFVCQTGSVIKEFNQIGKFKKVYVKQLKKLADKYKLNIKEHNADYLTQAEIKERKGLVSALNIAPQYGVMQTKLLLQKAVTYGIDSTPFLNTAYESKKWKKWLNTNTAANKYLCAVIGGHYNFTSKAYKSLYKQISKHENFREAIIQEMMNNFKMYLSVL